MPKAAKKSLTKSTRRDGRKAMLVYMGPSSSRRSKTRRRPQTKRPGNSSNVPCQGTKVEEAVIWSALSLRRNCRYPGRTIRLES
jgi:hypothetical protein